MDRLGHTPEGHRRQLRELSYDEGGRPFIFAQQLREAARRWLQPGTQTAEQVVERVVLEQFVAGLPASTGNWVQCHRPLTLDAAVVLAEDHLSLPRRARWEDNRSPPPPPARPVPAPRRRGVTLPTPHAPTPAPRHTHALTHSPQQITRTDPPSIPPKSQDSAPVRSAPRGAPQPLGQACWRCGQLGHFRQECPLMEVGAVVQVAGPSAPSPGPEGTYYIPVCMRGSTHQALMDTGCMQTMIHESLVRPGALLEAQYVKVKCVHGDIHKYPLVPIEIRCRGKR